MLIKLSNDMYVDLDRKLYITKRKQSEVHPDLADDWMIVFGGNHKLILSQAHLDELMACLPEPRTAEGAIEVRKASDRWKEIMERRDREKAERSTQ